MTCLTGCPMIRAVEESSGSSSTCVRSQTAMNSTYSENSTRAVEGLCHHSCGIDGGGDRIGDLLQIRQGVVQFHEGARHVVVRGHHDERVEMVRLGPAPGLDGVADGVAGPVIQVHAAIEEAALARIEPGDLVAAGVLVDAGDQQALGIALRQKVDGVADPLRAAGHRHDAVGAGFGPLLEAIEAVDESQEAQEIRRSGRGRKP